VLASPRSFLQSACLAVGLSLAFAVGSLAPATAAPLKTPGSKAATPKAAAPKAPAPKKEEGFQVAAPFAILIDADSGTVLYEKNADQLMFPSSMAKLMTAEFVFYQIKEGGLDPNEEFVISENAWRKGGAPSHGSSMFAAIHSKVKVMDLLKGEIIQSGNDACIALAEGIGGSEGTFAEMLNARAREIGLTKSTFTNATGLPDPNLKVTTRELAKLAQHIIKTYPEFYQLFGEREFTWNKIRQQNRNPLLGMSIGADGLKTGFTREAGYGLVGSAVQNGLRLIVVINGAKTPKERGDEARKLLEFGFRGFESRPLFVEGQIIGEAKLYGGSAGRVPLVAGQAVNLLVPRNAGDRIVARVVYTGPIPAPVQQDQPIGTLKIWRGEHVVLEVPLRAAESIGRGSLPQRALDAASELVINLVRAGFAKL
jgi:serine-type D-Ala-D-Ala carboxypeptidase (penicillin-binding protein 5/6)